MIVNVKRDDGIVTVRCDFSKLSFAPIAYSEKDMAQIRCGTSAINRELARQYARQIEAQIFEELEQAFSAGAPDAQADLS